MGIMEGRDGPHIRRKYADMLVPALIANWQVWPLAQVRSGSAQHPWTIFTPTVPMQFLNFRYMPLAYRVPFQSSCGVFWTLYLSILNSRCVCACVHAN